MIHSLHFVTHPDADNVTSFLERSLSEVQRRVFLDHLADCERCREVTWLARKATAASLTATSATIPLSRYEAESPGFPYRWSPAWISGLGLAASLALLMAFHVRRPTAPQTIAGRALRDSRTGSESELAESKGGPIPPSPVPPRKKDRATVSSYSPGREGESSSFQLIPRPVVPVRTASNEPLELSSETKASSQSPAGSRISAGPVTSASSHATKGFIPSSSVRIGDSYAQMVATLGEPAVVVRLNGGTVYRYPTQWITFVDDKASDVRSAVAMQQSSADHAIAGAGRPSSQFSAGFVGGSGAVGMVSAANAAPAKQHLPSGLSSISSASSGNRLLSLDSAGNLFLSNDKERAWQAVTYQWTGKAIRVRLAAPLNNEGTTVPSSGDVEIFELVNDAGAIWTSTDGRTWKPT